jgi:hypothetical protein
VERENAFFKSSLVDVEHHLPQMNSDKVFLGVAYTKSYHKIGDFEEKKP